MCEGVVAGSTVDCDRGDVQVVDQRGVERDRVGIYGCGIVAAGADDAEVGHTAGAVYRQPG